MLRDTWMIVALWDIGQQLSASSEVWQQKSQPQVHY